MLKALFMCALLVALPASAGEAPASDPAPRTAPPRATGIAPPKRIPDVVDDASRPAGEPVTTASIPREVRRAVVDDAAKRFKVAESSVVLTGAEQVTWSDGSLGCPEPGRFYTQALVPGFRLLAKTPEGQMTYHTDSHGNVSICGPAGTAPANRIADKTPQDSENDSAPRTRPPTPSPPKL